MDPALSQVISQGGASAIAVLLFVFYRKDVNSYTELWKQQCERSDKLTERVMTLVEKTVDCTTKNTEVLNALHRRIDRLDLLRVVNEESGEVERQHHA